MENLVEEILKEVKQFHLNENEFDEASRILSKKQQGKINQKIDDLAKQVYGDKYDAQDENMTNHYFPKGDREIRNNADLAGGIFSIGNAKLSDDTLVINFNSALGCPSVNDCPITQMACYAVAMENRLADTRRKHILVQKLVQAARSKNMFSAIFDIAELYILATREGKASKPIRYIRFNEVGDFVDNDMLIGAATFAKKMRDTYGILSMAYTSKKNIDPTIEIDGEPIDTIIAINRSRNDIPKSENALDRKFYGLSMPSQGFSSDPNINLDETYTDVVEVSDGEANRLKITTPIQGKHGQPSVPVLTYGKWSGGEGYYYVCPCSFWRYNKDKAAKEFLMNKGFMSQDEDFPTSNAAKAQFMKRIPKDVQKEMNKFCNKIISPCGIKCAVCHDMEGGVTADGQSGIKDYCILTATHGASAGNYNAEYANAKRQGDDSVKYSEDNPHGHWEKNPNLAKNKEKTDTTTKKNDGETKTKKPKSKPKYSNDSPIRSDFMTNRTTEDIIRDNKTKFFESYQRFFK